MKRPAVVAGNFHHLDGWNGWRFAAPPRLAVTPGGLALPNGALPTGVVAPEVMAKARARGLAFDRMGRAYAVAEGRKAFCLFASEDAQRAEARSCFDLIGGRLDTAIGGLAIDARGRLFVAFPELAEVRVYRLDPAGEIGRIPMRRPVDVAVDAHGRLLVLDVGDAATPAPSEAALVDVRRIHRTHGDALAVSSSGGVAVVTRGSTNVDLARDGTQFTELRLGRPVLPAIEFAADDPQRLFVGDAQSGRIVEWQIGADASATPRRWSAGIDAWTSLAQRGRQLFAIGRGCNPSAVELEAAGFYERSAAVLIGPLDAGTPGTEWHRVTAQLSEPATPNVYVTAEILADDDCEAYDPGVPSDDPRWEAPRALVSAGPNSPAELGFLSAKGRYAYLRLTLQGDGRNTPVLRWVRVEYPRDSYLRYLPAIYSEEPSSRDFTARLLSIFESANADMGRLVSELRRLFEPLAVDPEMLPWLAERLDVLLEPGWPVEKTRSVLARALSTYRRRGTRAAFLEMLADHGAPGARVIEGSQDRPMFILGNGHLGCDAVLPGSCAPPRMQLDRGLRLGNARLESRPYMEADIITERRGDLSVIVPMNADTPELVARVTRLAQLEAPAGANVRVTVTRPRFALGAGARLGLDVSLGGHAPWRLAGGADTQGTLAPMLLTREPGTGGDLSLGVGPRLGTDSKL